jgi:hypothetical protein
LVPGLQLEGQQNAIKILMSYSLGVNTLENRLKETSKFFSFYSFQKISFKN